MLGMPSDGMADASTARNGYASLVILLPKNNQLINGHYQEGLFFAVYYGKLCDIALVPTLVCYPGCAQDCQNSVIPAKAGI